MKPLYAPGDLVELRDDLGWDESYALILPTPQGRFTDTDFMGRPYIWIMVQGRILPVPQSNIMERTDGP